MGFVPIGIDEYVALHVLQNPGDDPVELRARLVAALAARQSGRTCECGNPIWVVGSAIVGHACFTCITLEAVPDCDYEIADAWADAIQQGTAADERRGRRKRMR